MLKRLLTLLTCLSLTLTGLESLAQDGKITKEDLRLLGGFENDLIRISDSMYGTPIPDMRVRYTEDFVKLLVQTLKTPNSYAYKFDSLGKKINVIYSEDKQFRIFNWNVMYSDVTIRYYGAIQMNAPGLKLYPLIDYTNELSKDAENIALADKKWYGTLIYRILDRKVDGQTIYTVFGVNRNSPTSNKKVMDPLVFTESGPVFGANIFNMNGQGENGIKRFILEYKKEVNASLNWDEELKAVVFDRLISQVNDPNRKYTYVPSGQYDGFRWENGHWIFVQDLIPIDNRVDGNAPAPQPRKEQKME